jgi:uncharacterized protein YbjT (DUF2867 family)
MPTVFISGATGYLGRPLTQALIIAGFDVHALTRPQSIRKLPLGCRPIPGNALDPATFQHAVPPHSTYIHLTGVAHPSPAKTNEFRAIDQTSFEASLLAARAKRASHFIYVSVAHPAPVMQDYIDVRRHCESRLLQSQIPATILRPWYILGEGHRWPMLLVPFYKLAEAIPSTRAAARRLGLITHRQMLAALMNAAVHPPGASARILDVPAIRAATSASASALSLPRRPSALSA